MHSIEELKALLENPAQGTFISRTCTQKQIDGTKTLAAVSDFRHPCGGQTFICDNENHYLWPGMEVTIGDEPNLYMRDFRFLTRRGAINSIPDAAATPAPGSEITKSMRDAITMIFDPAKVIASWTPEVIASINHHLSQGKMVPKSFLTATKEDTAHSYPIGYASFVWRELDQLGWRGFRPTGSVGNIMPTEAFRASTIEEVQWFLEHCPILKTV